MPFKPGQSGNPNGRPLLPQQVVKERQDLRDLARLQTLPALNVYIELMDEKYEPAIRLSAADRLIDRGWGKAAERKEVTGADGAPIAVIDQTPIIEVIKAMVEASRPKVVEAKVIDVKEDM